MLLILFLLDYNTLFVINYNYKIKILLVIIINFISNVNFLIIFILFSKMLM